MLISCAASGIAETMRAATEAATVLIRTRRPQVDAIRSCLRDGPTNSPSPVPVCRRALCLPSAWRPRARVLLRLGVPRGAAGEGAELRLPPRQRVQAQAPRVQSPAMERVSHAAPPVLACAAPLRAVAPFPRGFDRPPRAPGWLVAPACAV